MTFELNIKYHWHCPATSNHLEITKIKWSDASDPTVKTAQSLRQLQSGSWKIPVKPRTEELTNLLSGLQEIAKFLHFKNTHPLTGHFVKEIFRQCQSPVPDDQATSPKRNKTNYT